MEKTPVLGARRSVALAGALALLFVVAEAVALPVSSGSFPATVVIHIADLRFAPANARIAPGTTVIWHNNDTTFHQVAADDNSWSSPVLNHDEEFSRVFDAPAIIPYHCAIHEEMRGVLTVGSSLNLPLVARNIAFNLTPTPSPTATSTPGATSAVIGPAGGELDAPDLSLQVVVPPDALDVKARFDYVPATPTVPRTTRMPATRSI